MKDYAYLALELVEEYVPLAEKLDVSEVARGPGGFLSAYRQARGNPNRLSHSWDSKREGFISRHMAQLRGRSEPLFDDEGDPTRRHLALIMWAYSPRPSSL